LQDITVEEVNAVAIFMEKTKRFEDCIHIIDNLYLERGVHSITEGERLFKVLI
jgi:hypothetical protein